MGTFWHEYGGAIINAVIAVVFIGALAIMLNTATSF